MISTYTKHKTSAVGSLEIIPFTSQAADYLLKENPLSKDGGFSSFMPCLHWLANDIWGFSFLGRITTGKEENDLRYQVTERTRWVEPCVGLGGAGYE